MIAGFKPSNILSYLPLIYVLVLSASAQLVERINFDRFSHYQPDDWITYAPANQITSIDVGEEFVYFGSRHGGVLRYNLYEQFWDYPLTTSNGLRSNRILGISYQFENNTLYVKTPAGIDAYTISFGYAEPDAREALPPQRKPDAQAVKDYFSRADGNFPVFYRPSNKELPDFFLNRQFIYHNPSEILDEFNRSFRFNKARVTDRYRRLWLSTNGLGVAVVDLSTRELQLSRHSIPNIEVRDCLLDSSGIWIGGLPKGKEPHGISFWDDQEDRWHIFEARYNPYLANDAVFVIRDSGRFVFFGTAGGILRYDKSKGRWNDLNSFQRMRQTKVNDLLLAGERLYLATESGLYWMYPESDFLERFADQNLDQTEILKLTWFDSTLVATTTFGIFSLNPGNGRFERLDIRSALPETGFTALNTFNDSLWLAGDNGIAVFDKQKNSWRSFPGPAIRRLAPFHDIAFTEGFTWFASDKGLLRYNRQMDSWYLYSKKDGLASNRVYHIDTDREQLWLSTGRGLTIFRWLRPGRSE